MKEIIIKSAFLSVIGSVIGIVIYAIVTLVFPNLYNDTIFFATAVIIALIAALKDNTSAYAWGIAAIFLFLTIFTKNGFVSMYAIITPIFLATFAVMAMKKELDAMKVQEANINDVTMGEVTLKTLAVLFVLLQILITGFSFYLVHLLK